MTSHRKSVCTAVLATLTMVLLTNQGLAQPPQQERPRPGAKKRRPAPNRPMRHPDKLQQGDLAPTFSLKSLDGKKSFALADFKGKKPVALVFGSYT